MQLTVIGTTGKASPMVSIALSNVSQVWDMFLPGMGSAQQYAPSKWYVI